MSGTLFARLAAHRPIRVVSWLWLFSIVCGALASLLPVGKAVRTAGASFVERTPDSPKTATALSAALFAVTVANRLTAALPVWSRVLLQV
jgi:hypothetical protein